LSVSDEQTNSVSLKSKTNVSFIGTGSVEWMQDSLVFTLISDTLVVYICASLLELKLLFFPLKTARDEKVVLLNENSYCFVNLINF
jgi:hypothetical protein